LNAVRGGLPDHALCVFFLLWQGAPEKVCSEFLGLAPLLRFQREEQVGS
jgi:hypothetical protein